jgi:hypothetical protein
MGRQLKVLNRGREWSMASGQFRDGLGRAMGGVSSPRHMSRSPVRGS